MGNRILNSVIQFARIPRTRWVEYNSIQTTFPPMLPPEYLKLRSTSANSTLIWTLGLRTCPIYVSSKSGRNLILFYFLLLFIFYYFASSRFQLKNNFSSSFYLSIYIYNIFLNSINLTTHSKKRTRRFVFINKLAYLKQRKHYY